MTVRAKALCCDHPGCSSKILGGAGARSRPSKWLRRAAARAGWKRTEDGADLCPEHSRVARTFDGRPNWQARFSGLLLLLVVAALAVVLVVDVMKRAAAKRRAEAVVAAAVEEARRAAAEAGAQGKPARAEGTQVEVRLREATGDTKEAGSKGK